MLNLHKDLTLTPHIDLLKLDKDYWVVIVPNKIIFLSDTSENEIEKLIAIEKEKLVKEIEKGKSKANKKINNITFLPTSDCNLQCVYCYAKGGDEKIYMTRELAKAAINAIYSNKETSEINLHFAGGGEPFLNYDVMKFIVSYCNNLFNIVNVGLVTNGTFNKEHLQWVIDNNVDLRVSFDGLAQEYQRPPAEPFKEIIVNNIKTLTEINYEFIVQCIITSKNVNDMVENIRYLSNLGIKYVKLEPVHMSRICRGDNNLIPNPKNFVDNFIKMLTFINDNELDIKIDSSFFSRPTIGYYCGISDPNINITPQGHITACVEVTRKTDPFSGVIIYGKCLIDKEEFFFESASISKLKKLHFSKYEKCNKCNLKLICKAGCPVRNLFDHGFSFKPSKYTCQIGKILVPKVFSLIKNNPKYIDIIFEDCRVKVC